MTMVNSLRIQAFSNYLDDLGAAFCDASLSAVTRLPIHFI